MRALFDDGAFIQHQDAIGIDHAGKPVGKDQCGAPTHQSVERLLDDRFVLGIHRRQRFVENQDRCISQNRSGDCNTLSLTAREPDTAFANHRVVALGQQRNKLMRVGRAAGLLEFLSCGIGTADPQVVGDRAMKKIGILVHHRDLVTDISKTQAFKVVTTNLHHARVGIIKTQQQPYDRRLTRTTWANKAHSLTSRHTETQTLVRSASSARIGKTHPIKRHGGRKFLNRYWRFWLVDHRLGIHQLENRLRGRLRQHAVVHKRAHVTKRPIHLDPEHQHHQQHTKTHLAINHPKGPKGKRDRDAERNPGIGDAAGKRVGREDPHRGFKQGVGGVFEFSGAGGALAKGF